MTKVRETLKLFRNCWDGRAGLDGVHLGQLSGLFRVDLGRQTESGQSKEVRGRVGPENFAHSEGWRIREKRSTFHWRPNPSGNDNNSIRKLFRAAYFRARDFLFFFSAHLLPSIPRKKYVTHL